MPDATDDPTLELIGCYAGDWIWSGSEINRVKSLLPFFGKLALVIDEDLFDEAVSREPTLAMPLANLGLLVSRPMSLIQSPEASQLVLDTFSDLLGVERRELVWREEEPGIQRPNSLSRVIHKSISERLRERLNWHGPVRDALLRAVVYGICLTEQSNDIEMHPVAHSGTLPTFPHGLSLLSLIDRSCTCVGANLDRLPLDEVLDFRRSYASDYRRYMRHLMSVSAALETAKTESEYFRAISREVEAVRDAADDVSKRIRRDGLKTTLSVNLGMLGAAWAAASGNLVGAGIAGLSAAAGLLPSRSSPNTYTYLFDLPSS